MLASCQNVSCFVGVVLVTKGWTIGVSKVGIRVGVAVGVVTDV